MRSIIAMPSASSRWCAGEDGPGYDAARLDHTGQRQELDALVAGLDHTGRVLLADVLREAMGAEERAWLVRRIMGTLPEAKRETIGRVTLNALAPERRVRAVVRIIAGLDDARRGVVRHAVRPDAWQPPATQDDSDEAPPVGQAPGEAPGGQASPGEPPAGEAPAGEPLAGLAGLVAGWDGSAALAGLDVLIDRIAAEPLSGALDDDALLASVKALTRAGDRLIADRRRRVAELDDRRAFRGRGAMSTKDLLAAELHLTRAQAKTETDTAAALRHLPRTAACAAAGRIGAAQASEAARAAGRLTRLATSGAPVAPDALERLDAHTAATAPGHDPAQLRRSTEQLTAALAPSALNDRDHAWHTTRRAWLGRRADGTPTLEANLSATGYAALDAALQPLARKHNRADDRSYPQRLHDALIDLALRALDSATLPRQTRQRPHVLLIQRLDDPAPAHLDALGPVGAATAAQLSCHADTTIIREHACGRVCDVLPASSDPTRAMTKAVLARDRGCVGCGADLSRCQLHHIIWRRHHGPTAITNLVTVCHSCHHEIHHGDRVVHRTPDGRYTATRTSNHPNPPGRPPPDTPPGAAPHPTDPPDSPPPDSPPPGGPPPGGPPPGGPPPGGSGGAATPPPPPNPGSAPPRSAAPSSGRATASPGPDRPPG